MLIVILLSFCFLLLSLKDFRSALFLFLALLPTYLIRFSLGPIPTTMLEVLFGILFIVWFFKHDGRRVQWLSIFGPYRTPILLLLAASCFAVTIVPSEHLFDALGIWKAYFIEPILFFAIIRTTIRDERDAKSALFTLGISAFVISLLGIVQWITGFGIPAPWDSEKRITSVFDYPNALGLFLAPIVSACVVLVAASREQRDGPPDRLYGAKMISMMIIIMLSSIAIVLAKTEAAFIAIPVALVITTLLSPQLSRTKKYLLITSLLIVGLGSLAIEPIRTKIFLQDYSGQVRLSQWKETIALLKDHPITGSGLGNYPNALRPYHTDWQYEIFQYPHNILLNFWSELGLLGVIALLLFIWLVAKQVWNNRHDPFVLAAGAALLTMCIHGLVDVPFFKNDLAMLTAFFLALSVISTKQNALINI